EPKAFMARNALLLRNTTIGNLFDLCAVSLPIPRAGNLPCGLMLLARNGHDRRLLRIAAAVERVFAERCVILRAFPRTRLRLGFDGQWLSPPKRKRRRERESRAAIAEQINGLGPRLRGDERFTGANSKLPQRLQQHAVALGAQPLDQPRFVLVGQRLGARKQPLALARQPQRVAAAVGRGGQALG